MIDDHTFNSLKWQEVGESELKILQGAHIEALESMADYWDDHGRTVINGLLLYITDSSNNKKVIYINAPAELVSEQLVIQQANVREVEKRRDEKRGDHKEQSDR